MAEITTLWKIPTPGAWSIGGRDGRGGLDGGRLPVMTLNALRGIDRTAADRRPPFRARNSAYKMSAMGKKTGRTCWREKLSVSDLESSSLAGFRALIWSNLCTRHIPKKLTPRGHHDWPDKISAFLVQADFANAQAIPKRQTTRRN
jgi:hypothetical protein